MAGAHQSPEPPHEEGSAPQLVCEQNIGEAHDALHQPPAQELKAEDGDGPVAVQLRLDGLLCYDCSCAEQHAKDQPGSRNGWQQHPLHKISKSLEAMNDIKQSMTVMASSLHEICCKSSMPMAEGYSYNMSQHKRMTQGCVPVVLTMLECWANSSIKWMHGQAHRHRMAAR